MRSLGGLGDLIKFGSDVRAAQDIRLDVTESGSVALFVTF